MNKFLEFLKKHWIAVTVSIVVVFFAIVGVPFFINWFFSVPALCNFFVVDWEAKDALSYYGDALGFIGTVIFSGLALWQNHIIKTESDNRAKLSEKMELQKHLPIFSVRASACSKDGMTLAMKISTLSENVALDVTLSKIQILNEDGSEFWVDPKERKYSHIGGNEIALPLENPSFENTKQIMTFRIVYKDKFEQYHTLLVEGKQMGVKPSFPKFFIKEI